MSEDNTDKITEISVNNKNNERIKEIEKIIKEVEKEYGKGSIMLLGANNHLDVEIISSGSLILNQALGILGYPKGRIIEIFGPESSGKTTLSLHAIAQTQKADGIAAFIDAEHALDPNYAQKIGVDTNNLIIAQPDSGEQALDILETLVKSEIIDIVIVDSVAALVPKIELEGEMSDQVIGAQARLMSKALRKLNGVISKSKCVVIFINQIREKIGTFFGNPEVTTGGRALRFYASIRMDVRRVETIIENNNPIGSKIKIKIVKNKLSPPFKTALITLNYEQGIDFSEEIIDLAVEYNLIKKSGSWYNYEHENIGQGKQMVKLWLDNNPEIRSSLLNILLEKIKN